MQKTCSLLIWYFYMCDDDPFKIWWRKKEMTKIIVGSPNAAWWVKNSHACKPMWIPKTFTRFIVMSAVVQKHAHYSCTLNRLKAHLYLSYYIHKSTHNNFFICIACVQRVSRFLVIILVWLDIFDYILSNCCSQKHDFFCMPHETNK